MTKQYAPIVNGKQYAVQRAVRKYYKNVDVYDYFKYEYEPWVQPVLTSYTSYGKLTYSTYDTKSGNKTNFPWKALDGNSATNWEMGQTVYSGWLNWKLPETIFIKGVQIAVKSGDRPIITARCYTDDTMTIPIGNSISTSVSGESKTVTGIPSDGVETDNVYIAVSSTQNYPGLSEITITAETRTVVNGTAEDYDYREHVRTDIVVSTADDYDFYKDEIKQYVVTR